MLNTINRGLKWALILLIIALPFGFKELHRKERVFQDLATRNAFSGKEMPTFAKAFPDAAGIEARKDLDLSPGTWSEWVDRQGSDSHFMWEFPLEYGDYIVVEKEFIDGRVVTAAIGEQDQAPIVRARFLNKGNRVTIPVRVWFTSHPPNS